MNWGTAKFLLPLLPLVPMVLLASVLLMARRWLDRDDRRDPLTTEIRLLPAAGVSKAREIRRERLLDKLVESALIGYTLALLMLLHRLPAVPKPWIWYDTALLVLALAYVGYQAFRLAKELPELRSLQDGTRAEQAVAQEIGTVLAGNNRLIHNVQAKDFNIDHVVITPAGVFAVETKSRRKPPAGGGDQAVRVRYDGRRLEFPGWVETKPLAQAERQARWLAQHLKAATGDAVAVTPVLALPGWFVENTARIEEGMVRVVNPKGATWLFLPNRAPVLDPAAIQRIGFQVEKLALAAKPG